MKKYIYSILAATAFLAAGCSDKDDLTINQIPDDQKSKIEFSMSDAGASSTRAGFSGPKTQIVARFVSQESGTSNIRYTLTTLKAAADAQAVAGHYWTTSGVSYYADDHSNDRYWDDAFGRKANISVYAIAVPNIDNRATGYPALYSLFADAGTTVGTTPWKTGSDDQKISWSVNYEGQSSTTLDEEDLAYSNNICTGGKKGVYKWDFTSDPQGYPKYATGSDDNWTINTTDGPLMFHMPDGASEGDPGKFDQGHLEFKHALSRLTIKLYAGKGFNMDLTTKPFDFASGTNINLFTMPQSGTFDIAAGDWVGTPTTKDIVKMTCTTKSTSVSESNKSETPVYTLSAQVLPGYVFDKSATTTNVMHFKIDDNDYYITSAQIFKALNDNAGTGTGKNGLEASATSYKMEQGKNYLLNISVDKTAISNVTATLVNWVEVAGKHTATNGYISLDLLDAGATNTQACEHFKLYRLLNKSASLSTPTNSGFDNANSTLQSLTGYTTDTPLCTETTGDFNHDATNKKWHSKWFFQDSYSFYHFRTTNPGVSVTTESTQGDYFKMYSGPVNDTYSASDMPTAAGQNKYNDYHWGATYDNTTGSTNGYLNYDNGFSHISGPIGPYKNTEPTTDKPLSIIEQHMMANIKIILETPKSEDDDYPARILLFDESKADGRKTTVITLKNLYNEATVRMQNGKIEPDGSLGDATMTQPTWTTKNEYFATGKVDVESKEYTYRVIPQQLTRTSDKVGIHFLTPDDNVYFVVDDLSEITVNGAPTGHPMKGDHSSGDYITQWYPGYTYVYRFRLKKTGIENITCTIVDWKTVTGTLGNVTLEN